MHLQRAKQQCSAVPAMYTRRHERVNEALRRKCGWLTLPATSNVQYDGEKHLEKTTKKHGVEMQLEPCNKQDQVHTASNNLDVILVLYTGGQSSPYNKYRTKKSYNLLEHTIDVGNRPYLTIPTITLADALWPWWSYLPGTCRNQ